MKKMVIIISTIALISIVVGVVLVTRNLKQDPDKVTYSFEVEKVDLCVDEENCPIIVPEFPILEYNTLDKENLKIINEINDETRRYYRMSEESTMDDATCAEEKDIYKHSILIHSDISVDKGKEKDTISVERIIFNLCTNESQNVETKTYTINKT